MKKKTKLHFSRFEFKYLLNKSLREEVEGQLRYFLDFDDFVVDKPSHRYFVRSLYFDDPSFSAYYDKLDGLHTRWKFRMRTYTNEPCSTVPVFLEVKGRYNNLVFKNRVELNDYDGVSGEELGRYAEKHELDQPVCRQFAYERFRKQLRPVALVDYYRRPYVSRYDPEFRLTFDEQLCGTATNRLHPGTRRQSRQILAGYTVMEVKFRRHIPSWFHRVIQSFELQRRSISKICEAMSAVGLARDLS